MTRGQGLNSRFSTMVRHRGRLGTVIQTVFSFGFDCATGSTAAYNTTRVFEQWSLLNCASAVRDISARAKGTPVAPTADSKRNALLSALFWPFRELLRSPLRKNLPLPARLWYSGNFLSQTTLTRSYFSTDLFWTTSTRFDLRETLITNFAFSFAVYFC